MNTKFLAGTAIVLSFLATGAQAGGRTAQEFVTTAAEPYPSSAPANASASGALTRQQVKAELAEALRLGDLPVDESGRSARAADPAAWPARPSRLAH